MTKDGCIENGKNNRCALFDTSQPRWTDVSTNQISEANVKHATLLEF